MVGGVAADDDMRQGARLSVTAAPWCGCHRIIHDVSNLAASCSGLERVEHRTHGCRRAVFLSLRRACSFDATEEVVKKRARTLCKLCSTGNNFDSPRHVENKHALMASACAITCTRSARHTRHGVAVRHATLIDTRSAFANDGHREVRLNGQRCANRHSCWI